MAMRGWAVHKNHNPTLYIIELSSHNHLFFHNGFLSGPYLGKYKRDWNETWFTERW